MLNSILVATVVLAFAAALTVAPHEVEARDYYQVYNNADSGPGTLRDAVEEANASGRRTTIVLAKGVTLSSPVEYTGSQPLMIQGSRANRNRTIDANGGCGVLKSSGGADVTLQDVTLVRSVCTGLEVGGEPKDGELALVLRRVTVRAIGEDGVRLFDPEGSPASLRLDVRDSQFFETRGDGISFDERGPGTVSVAVSGSWFSVAANGIAGREEGAGDLGLAVLHSEFSDNGVHGIKVTEDGAGAVVVSLSEGYFKSNGVDGLNVQERGDGSVAISARGTSTSGNGGEGIVVQESDAGDVTVGPAGLDVTTGDGDAVVLGLLLPLP